MINTKDILKIKFLKLDNAAKAFSLDDKNHLNVFRFTAILKENIDEKILEKALNKSLNYYLIFKVKFHTGLFWKKFEANLKKPIIKKENKISCQNIDLKENNDYLFRVTYYENKINIDILHVLTDGLGAADFFKCIISNYLDLKYNLNSYNLKKEKINYEDQYLKVYDKYVKINEKFSCYEAYLLPGKIGKKINNTYHYLIDIKEIKKVCKKYKATITEYLTAIYIYAIYLSLYNRKSKKEIVITIPINLRKYYFVDTLANFFVCMDINAKIIEKNITNFDELLTQIRIEFKEKLTEEKIKEYLARDVKIGTNKIIKIVPLFLKKLFIKYILPLIYKSSTSTVSNLGIIDLKDNYKNYIENIFVLVMPGLNQKIKCTISSFENYLNVIINSNINSTKFINTLTKLLKKDIANIKLK